MFNRIIFLMIACSLMLIGISGCVTVATKERTTIGPESIQAIMDDPSGSTMPLEGGDEISIVTKRKISISSTDVNFVKMVVNDANSTRIRGRVIVGYDRAIGPGKEALAGNIVDVKLEDIKKIKVTAVKTKLDPVHKNAMLDNLFTFGILLLLGLTMGGL